MNTLPVLGSDAPLVFERDPWTAERVELVKRTIAKGASDIELELFIEQCRRTKLDPFSRQIYAIQRWDGSQNRNVMTWQVSIDGLRLIADRTGRYVPGRDTVYTYDEAGNLKAATAFVRKMVAGEWHEIAATARWEEYAAKTKQGSPTAMWRDKPHVMLGKCAEALALRKAFPAETSGLYTAEEMPPAVEVTESPRTIPTPHGRVDYVTGEIVEQNAQEPPREAAAAPQAATPAPTADRPKRRAAWATLQQRAAEVGLDVGEFPADRTTPEINAEIAEWEEVIAGKFESGMDSAIAADPDPFENE